jgi:hypothetical protein
VSGQSGCCMAVNACHESGVQLRAIFLTALRVEGVKRNAYFLNPGNRR